MPPMIGKQVSHYRLDRKLGAGTFGEVYRGIHVHDEELLAAVKVVHPSLATDPDFVDALRAECKHLYKLQHSGIVGFRELVISDTNSHPPAMVVELLDGEDLESRIARSQLSIAEVTKLGREALEALAYAHEQRILHRDIKPSNMFVTQGGLKLIDFGISRAANASQAASTGKISGTLEYLAPEIFMGKKPSASADIYALGLVLWEALTRQTACPKGPPGAKMGWHMGVGVTDPRTLRADCPEALAALVLKMASKEPGDRPNARTCLKSSWGDAASAAPANPGPAKPRQPPPTVSFKLPKLPKEDPPSPKPPAPPKAKPTPATRPIQQVQQRKPQPKPAPKPPPPKPPQPSSSSKPEGTRQVRIPVTPPPKSVDPAPPPPKKKKKKTKVKAKTKPPPKPKAAPRPKYEPASSSPPWIAIGVVGVGGVLGLVALAAVAIVVVSSFGGAGTANVNAAATPTPKIVQPAAVPEPNPVAKPTPKPEPAPAPAPVVKPPPKPAPAPAPVAKPPPVEPKPAPTYPSPAPTPSPKPY